MEKAFFWILIIGLISYTYFPKTTVVIIIILVLVMIFGYFAAKDEEKKKLQAEEDAKRNEEIEKAAKDAEKLRLEAEAEQKAQAEQERVSKHNADMEIAQREYIISKCQPYIAALAKKRQRLVTYDDYGDPDYKLWAEEISRFFSNKIGELPDEIKMISVRGSYGTRIPQKEITAIIDTLAAEGQKDLLPDEDIVDDMDGIDFEHYCSDKLKVAGWITAVSSASGDQGADIIAEYNDIKVAIQCKRFSKPVGNKAVQEVAAARSYYGSDFAVVVTNNTFTKSAKQLANTNDVHLIHYSELGELASLLNIE
ncbi:DUF2034 domain-containing protein [Alishewanella longhuensis]